MTLTGWSGAGGRETFDRLFAEGAPLVREGLHQRETPPAEGGRWPVSIVLRPEHTSAERSNANILHFATGIARPAELISWVAQRREVDLGRVMMDTAELVRFRYEDGLRGRLMRPGVLASIRMGDSAHSHPGQPAADRL
jgi:hypothetical protein